jgi:hypothetical protein
VHSETIGTGTAIRRNGIEALLTASHNLIGASTTQIQFFPRATTAIDWDNSTPQGIVEYEFRKSAPISEIKRSSKEDLALVVMRDPLEAIWNVRCFDFNEGVSPPIGISVGVIGHPSSTAQEIGETNVAPRHIEKYLGVRPTFAGCKVLPPPSFLIQDFQAERHFVASFDYSTGVKPQGFSGCAAWYRSSSRANLLWSSSLRFGGLLTHSIERKGVVKFLRPEVVLLEIDELLR